MNFSDHIKRIALNIRAIRKSKKLTVQEVAYRCDMERSNLSRIEAGKSNITVKTICQIGDALGVSFEDIALGVRDPEDPIIKKSLEQGR